MLKPLSSAIAIGTGGPFGAEGPIIMTGGAIGSLFAQRFHLSSHERKTLLVAGAAAGMTGVFGTPVAAVLLAVELLLFEWKPRSFLPVTAAVLVAAVVRPLLLGHGPLFPMAVHPDLGWTGLLLAAGRRDHRGPAVGSADHPALQGGGRLREAEAALDVVAGAGRPGGRVGRADSTRARSAWATT